MEKSQTDHNGISSPHYDNSASSGYHLGNDVDSESALKKMRTAGSISMSPELFEKIYLSPKNHVKKDLRQTFGNPTPLALIGFLLALTPLSNALMGWRGSGGTGAATVGTYFFFGGLCMVLGGVGEWLLGNTFPFVVFTSFGGFWLSFGASLVPFYNASIAYEPNDPAASGSNPEFAATFAFFLLYMALLSFVYLVCSIRTNVFFVIIFLSLVVGFSLLAGAYWNIAEGNLTTASRLQTGGGAALFVTCLSGWYIFIAQMLASVDFPLALPVIDLSSVVHGASERANSRSKRDIEKGE